MLRRHDLINNLNDAVVRSQGKLPYAQAMKIFVSLWEEGISLGVLPPKDYLEGIETDIRLAKVLNSCLKKSLQG